MKQCCQLSKYPTGYMQCSAFKQCKHNLFAWTTANLSFTSKVKNFLHLCMGCAVVQIGHISVDTKDVYGLKLGFLTSLLGLSTIGAVRLDFLTAFTYRWPNLTSDFSLLWAGRWEILNLICLAFSFATSTYSTSLSALESLASIPTIVSFEGEGYF